MASIKKSVVILAGGRSIRMGDIDKIFYKIKGKPLLFYTIFVFEKHSLIDDIILVGRKDNKEKFSKLIKKYNFKKVFITEGGKKRQDSAFNGLKKVNNLGANPKDLILFHNGANPLVSKEEITKIIKAGKEYGAALLGQFAKDTIKKVNKKNLVTKTLNRDNIFLAQTPQIIEYKLARKAFSKAFEENFYGTDSASLVERLGKSPKVVPCSYNNFKVTTKEDLAKAENLLKKKNNFYKK